MYVLPAWRGRGVATALCYRLLEAAALKAIPRVSLQTEALDGGRYAKAGWEVIERVDLGEERLLVMGRGVTPSSAAGPQESSP